MYCNEAALLLFFFAKRCKTKCCNFVEVVALYLSQIDRIFALYGRNWCNHSLHWCINDVSSSFQHIPVIFNVSFTFLLFFF